MSLLPEINSHLHLSAAPPIETSDSAQTALRNCISRIEQLIHKVKLKIPQNNLNLNAVTCSISLEVPKDPVVTHCGHLYERTMIQQWREGTCPICKDPIQRLSPVHILRSLIETWAQEEPIITCSHFKGLNQQHAEKYLGLAKSFIDENEAKEALEVYGKALQYTNSSEVYALIPPLYEQLREPSKATLSYFYLSLYQIQEGKIREAIQTLKRCESDDLKLGALITALTLQLCPSHEQLKEGLSAALQQDNLEDKIFIYKQIITYNPNHLEAYIQLLPLIKDLMEKRYLLLKAADAAASCGRPDLEASFHALAEKPIVPTIISQEEWADAEHIYLPPYPQELKDFLSADCTMWPGKKRSETHIVVPLFPTAAINGAFLPLTLDSLQLLDKSSGGAGYRYLWDQIPKNEPAEQAFRYAVMTTDVLPGSRNLSYEDQLKLLPPGYEAPGVFDATRAILWAKRYLQKEFFSHNPWTYTHCKEVIQDFHLIVGGFAPNGLYVSSHSKYGAIGLAGWKKF